MARNAGAAWVSIQWRPRKLGRTHMFTASGWRSGRDTANPKLGLRIRVADRDNYFHRAWTIVRLRLPGGYGVAVVNLRPSFWREHPELRSSEINAWLRGTGAFPWPRGRPPRYRVRADGGGLFTVGGRVASPL